MPLTCITPSEARRKWGFTESFMNRIRRWVGDDPDRGVIRNVLKNLGIDDERALDIHYTTSKGGKKKLFARNVDEIKEWNPKQASEGVPSRTVVKVTRADGAEDFFMAARNDVTTRPTRWEPDVDKIHPNPDWIPVNKNALLDGEGAPVLYKNRGGRRYTPLREGEIPEEGSFLNVQRIYEGKASNVSYKDLAEQGYDAIRYPDGSIKPLHDDQVINPRKLSQRDNWDSFEKKSEQTTKQADKKTEREVQESMETLGIPSKVAATIAGWGAGQLVDSEDDFGGPWLGAAMGLALAYPSVRNGFKGVFKKGKETGKDLYDIMAEGVQKAEKNQEELREAVEMGGFRGDITDPDKVAEFKDKFFNEWKRLKSIGASVRDFVLDNDYFRSGASTLWRLGSERARELLRTFQGLEGFPSTLMERHTSQIEKYFGRATTWDDFKAAQIDLVNRYIDSRPALREQLGDVSEDELRRQLGSSVHRIITYQTKLDDAGKLLFDEDNISVKQIYQNEAKSRLDQFVLADQEGQRILNVMKDTFEEYRGLAETEFRAQIDQLLQNEVFTQNRRLLQQIIDSGLSIKQWIKAADAEQIKQYRKVISSDHELRDEAFREAIQWYQHTLRLENLKGRYVPQIYSFDKAAREKARFLKNNGLENAKKTVQDKEWYKHQTQRIIALNRDQYNLMERTAAGTDVEVKYWKSFKRAFDEVRNHLIRRIEDPTIRSIVTDDFSAGNEFRVSEYLQEVEQGGETFWVLKNPEKFQKEGINILDDMNQEAISKAHRMFINDTILKESRFLDNPRRFNLPTELLDTDLESIIRTYAKDAGNRIYMIRHNMGTENQLERAWLGSIKKELKGKIDDEVQIQDSIDRVRSWYANMSRTPESFEVGLTASEKAAKFHRAGRRNKLIRTLKNLGYMPFLWFTPFYALFQPFVMGPYFARWGNLGKSYGAFFKNPEKLKSVTDELTKMGIIERKIWSYAPEMQEHMSKDMLAGSDASVLDWMYNLSEKGVHFSSRFSFVKPLLEKMGADLENTGLFRLFAGDMLDISGAESALTTMAVMRQIEEYVDAGKKLIDMRRQQPDAALETTHNGVTYRWGDVKRSMEEFGIENPERFIEESASFNNNYGKSQISSFINKLEGADVEMDKLPNYLREKYVQVADTIVNQYHGRTRTSRPLKWTNNPYGRLLSQFQVYSQNFAVQTVQRRMLQPIRDWNQTYRSGKADKTPMMKIMWWMQRGNDDKLKEVFGDQWKQAYNDFPVQAFNNFFKVTPAVLGVGSAMLMTRGAVTDTLSMIANEAMGNEDYEQWRSVKQEFILNPYDKESKQVSISDLFDDDLTGFEIGNAFLRGLYNVTELAYLGPVGQLAVQRSRFSEGGLWSNTVATGMIDDFYKAFTSPFRTPIDQWGTTVPREIADFTLERSPILGSFHDVRKGMVNALFQKPKNRQNMLRWNDGDTGFQLQNIETIDF